jgi:hypothetical protein
MELPVTGRLIDSIVCLKVLMPVQTEEVMNGQCQPKTAICSNQDLRFALGCAAS